MSGRVARPVRRRSEWGMAGPSRAALHGRVRRCSAVTASGSGVVRLRAGVAQVDAHLRGPHGVRLVAAQSAAAHHRETPRRFSV